MLKVLLNLPENLGAEVPVEEYGDVSPYMFAL
jgi:hypothetical protein